MPTNLIVGAAFVLIGIVLLIVDPKELPGPLQLETFARHRVLFALITIALGGVLTWAAIMAPAVN